MMTWRRMLVGVWLLGGPSLGWAEEPRTATEAAVPSADELLKRIDENMVYDSRTAMVTMKVANARRVREFQMHTYGRGADESAIEYLAPAREKGTRMLKKSDELWMYLPSVERTQKISGHMLRQGMMGSDVSYEDMMNNTRMREMYDAKVTGEDTLEGRVCWKIEMNATSEDVSYPKRVTWLDKETYIPLRQELYALSGMLLKTWTMSDIVEMEGRQVAKRMRIEDKLQEGTYTEILTDEIHFGVELPAEVFSTRWLERGN